MNLKKIGNSFLTIIITALLISSSVHAQKETETQQSKIDSATVQTTSVQPSLIKIYGTQLILISSPDRIEISKAPVNKSGAGGFKVSKAGTFFVKATFGKKVESKTIKELNFVIKYPDGTKKTLTTNPAANGKSVESAEFEWTETAKPIFAYLTSTQGKVNTLAMSEAKE